MRKQIASLFFNSLYLLVLKSLDGKQFSSVKTSGAPGDTSNVELVAFK